MAFDRVQHHRHNTGREGKPGPLLFQADGRSFRNGLLNPPEQDFANPGPSIALNQDESPRPQTPVVRDMHGFGQQQQQAVPVGSGGAEMFAGG